MHGATHLVFDETVQDTDPATSTHLVTMYSSLEHGDFLASATRLAFQVVVDVLSIRSDVPLSVTIQHSADGQNWQGKNAAPEVSGTVSRAGGTVQFVGSEPAPSRPSLRFMRLSVNAGGSVGPFAFRVAIYAVHRNWTVSRQTAAEHASLPSDHTLFGMRHEVVHEIESLLRMTNDMPARDRHEFLMKKLSARARVEMNALQSRLLSLPPETKRTMLGAAMGTIALLMAPLPEVKVRAHTAEPTLCDDCLPRTEMGGEVTHCQGGCEPAVESGETGRV